MYCKNCGSQINEGQACCNNCGSPVEINSTQRIAYKPKKWYMARTILSFILLVLSIFPYVLFFMSLASNPQAMAYAIMLLFFPFMVLIFFSADISLKSIQNFSRGKELDIQFNKNRIIFNYIDKTQFIIFILMFILVIPLGLIAVNVPKLKLKKELIKTYSNNYEIIDDSRCVTSSNNYTAIIKLKDKNMYSLFHYEMGDKASYDFTDGILKGRNISLDNYFKGDYVSLAFINDIGYTKEPILKISIIVNYNDYNQDELATIIKTIRDDFDSKYEEFRLIVYVTNHIDKSKIENYNLYLIAELASFSCGFNNDYNQNLDINLAYSSSLNDIYSIKQELNSNLN